jgi:hypothetical protein
MSECGLETSTIRLPRPIRAVCGQRREVNNKDVEERGDREGGEKHFCFNGDDNTASGSSPVTTFS